MMLQVLLAPIPLCLTCPKKGPCVLISISCYSPVRPEILEAIINSVNDAPQMHQSFLQDDFEE
jgi:hypothetical protein